MNAIEEKTAKEVRVGDRVALTYDNHRGGVLLETVKRIERLTGEVRFTFERGRVAVLEETDPIFVWNGV